MVAQREYNMINVSVCASSIRPHLWQKMYDSLTQNTCSWEMIMVGPNQGESPGPNFKHIQTNVKPSQCYEIAFRAAQGETLTWTADDAVYSPCGLDIAYRTWKSCNDERVVVAFRTIEDGRDITDWHRLRGRDPDAPKMAPFGLMSTKMFHQFGGYDNRFVCGQSENDIVMRLYEIGGRLEGCEAQAIVNHNEHHNSGTVFRQGFFFLDRLALESNWIDDKTILRTRLSPVRSFINDGILEITQGEKGHWL